MLDFFLTWAYGGLVMLLPIVMIIALSAPGIAQNGFSIVDKFIVGILFIALGPVIWSIGLLMGSIILLNYLQQKNKEIKEK